MIRVNTNGIELITPVKREEEIHVGVTHSGKFHADDCMGAAILILATGNDIEFTRVAEVPKRFEEADNAIIFDIGGGEFDHHQLDCTRRNDGHKYAATGLLWKKYGEDICGSAAYLVDNDFLKFIDYHDNGAEFNLYSVQVGKFLPTWDELIDAPEDLMDKKFAEATRFCLITLINCIRDAMARVKSRNVVIDAIRKQEEPELLVLDQYIPAMEFVIEENQFRASYNKILYIICPSTRRGWSVTAVGVKGDRFKNLMPFPEEWRGKTEEELRSLTDGLCFFCHSVGFTASADSKEDAVKLANMSIRIGMNQLIPG